MEARLLREPNLIFETTLLLLTAEQAIPAEN